MKTFSSRRGSALLIVLGMLSFLIVSAVGFSAYMRFARLPSSYLRRTSSTRLLVKAALAEAIDAVDSAVCNNPHPGIGAQYIEKRSDGWRLAMDPTPADPKRSRNIWVHRVFIGTNDTRIANASVISPDLVKSGSPTYDTVSPLSMEALAYIPAPLVNEARAYSRVAPTAAWRTLDFDAGRYAYVALDVSDYFDVNRLTADVPRSSSPRGRVSLAYLFENSQHTAPGTGASQWDSFMKKFREFDEDTLSVDFSGKNPLISVADFNLALGKAGGIGGMKSPFYNYIMNNSGSGGFYQSAGQSDEDAIARMTFVTDGLFPQDSRDYDDDGTAAGGEIYDLGDSSHQPFPMSLLATKGGRKPTLAAALMGQGMNDRQKWIEHLGRVGCAALFDYLDTDHVPCSLALPVTERVPMICGASVNYPGSKFQLKKEEPEPSAYKGPGGADIVTDPTSLPIGTSQQVEATVLYKIDSQQFAAGFMAGSVKALALYPFSRPDDALDGSFNIDGRFALFFSTEKMNLRTGNKDDALQISTKQIPSGSDTKTFTDNGLLSARFTPQSFGPVNNISTDEDALKQFDNIRLSDGSQHAPRLAENGNEFLRVTYTWTRTVVNSSEIAGLSGRKWDVETLAEAKAADRATIGKLESAFKMLDKGGNASQDFLGKVKQSSGPAVRLNAAVWLRVTDGNDTVDMVPASIIDDKVQNNVPDVQNIYQGLANRLGHAGPLLKFDTGLEFDMSIDRLDELASAGQDIAISPKSIVCPDPRFNHAPESWLKLDTDLAKDEWKKKTMLGNGGRDRDFYLATSDAGYLQSKWELAQLQRFGGLDSYGGDETLGNMSSPPASQDDYAAAPENVLNHAVMWRTYDPFEIDEEAFANLPWKSEGSGQKVNPYSDSDNVLMAAFANTPVDWRRASTNNLAGTDYASMTSAQFNKEYAFNEYSSKDSAKIRWQTLASVAARFKALVREKAADGDKGGIAHWVEKRRNRAPQYTPWEEAWQDMDWLGPDDGTELCGAVFAGNEATLHDCDRKFLYGYWRDCFAPKQQLYLVFARAEPAMMGGDVSGQVPPQLGARAMAVVWRDPYRTKQDGDIYRPHRTRVLFYRQFE